MVDLLETWLEEGCRLIPGHVGWSGDGAVQCSAVQCDVRDARDVTFVLVNYLMNDTIEATTK